jgi:hypothetical protein
MLAMTEEREAWPVPIAPVYSRILPGFMMSLGYL